MAYPTIKSMHSCSSAACSLVHEAEKCVQIHLVILAARNYLVHDGLQVVEGAYVWNVLLRHELSIDLLRVLYNILGHIEETLEISQRVVSLTLVNLSIQFALAGTVSTSLVD